MNKSRRVAWKKHLKSAKRREEQRKAEATAKK